MVSATLSNSSCRAMKLGPLTFQWASLLCAPRSMASASRAFSSSVTSIRTLAGKSLRVSNMSVSLLRSSIKAPRCRPGQSLVRIGMISAIYGWRLGVVAEATDADRCVQQSPCGHEPEPQVDGSQGAAEVEHLQCRAHRVVRAVFGDDVQVPDAENPPDAVYAVVDEVEQVAGSESDPFEHGPEHERQRCPQNRGAPHPGRHHQQVSGDRRVPQHGENRAEQYHRFGS